MNMKDAFRFQNKLKGLMCEATAILQDRRNIVKVKTTHLRSKVMSDTQDAVVEEAAPSEYAGHANEVSSLMRLPLFCPWDRRKTAISKTSKIKPKTQKNRLFRQFF